MPLFRALAKNMAASYFGKKAPYGFVMEVTLLYVFILCRGVHFLYITPIPALSWTRVHFDLCQTKLQYRLAGHQYTWVGHQYTLIGQTINLSFTFKVRQNVQCPLYVGLSTDILRPALNICYNYCSLSLIFYNYEAFWHNCQFFTIIKYCLYSI